MDRCPCPEAKLEQGACRAPERLKIVKVGTCGCDWSTYSGCGRRDYYLQPQRHHLLTHISKCEPQLRSKISFPDPQMRNARRGSNFRRLNQPACGFDERKHADTAVRKSGSTFPRSKDRVRLGQCSRLGLRHDYSGKIRPHNGLDIAAKGTAVHPDPDLGSGSTMLAQPVTHELATSRLRRQGHRVFEVQYERVRAAPQRTIETVPAVSRDIEVASRDERRLAGHVSNSKSAC